MGCNYHIENNSRNRSSLLVEFLFVQRDSVATVSFRLLFPRAVVGAVRLLPPTCFAAVLGQRLAQEEAAPCTNHQPAPVGLSSP